MASVAARGRRLPSTQRRYCQRADEEWGNAGPLAGQVPGQRAEVDGDPGRVGRQAVPERRVNGTRFHRGLFTWSVRRA
jgi:hypothetical protein